MANDISNDRYWKLDTVATILGTGKHIRVQKLKLIPSAVNDSATVQEYVSGSLDEAAYLKSSGATEYGNDELDFSAEANGRGRLFNGFRLSGIDNTAVLLVFLGPA